MNAQSLSRRAVVIILLVAGAVWLFPAPRPAHADEENIRIYVNKWRVDPGDSYTISWMEGNGVEPISDFTLEESSDPQFRDRDNYSRYVVRAHRKSFVNNVSFTHTVRYYRVRVRAWVRNFEGQQTEDEIVSRPVRVILLGTEKTPPPSFPDDPETPVHTSKKKGEKKKGPDYPSMGMPDLVVARIALDPPNPKANQPFRARLSIRNQGVVPSPACQVRVDIAGREFLIDCEPLKPNYAADVLTPVVSVARPGPTTINAMVDPYNVIAESREDNNTLSRTFTVLAPPTPPAPKKAQGTPPTPGPSPSASPSSVPSQQK